MVPRRFRGFTLVEVLLVMGLLAALMAIGAGVYLLFSSRMKGEAVPRELETTLRQCRASALYARAPARVQVEERRVSVWQYQLAGLWRFEKKVNGAFVGARDLRAYARCVEEGEGKIGNAAVLWSGREATGYLECEQSPDFDCENGGYLEAYVYGQYEFDQLQFVFRKKDCYELGINDGGFLVGRVGMKAEVRSPHYRVPPRRWTKVAFAWDAHSLRLLADDAVVGLTMPGRATPVNEEPLCIGDSMSPLVGRIDEVRIFRNVRGRTFETPPEVTLVHNAAPWNAVHFGPDGALDPRYHAGGLRFDLRNGEKQRSVFVSLLGEVKVGDPERVPPPEPETAPAAASSAAKPGARP